MNKDKKYLSLKLEKICKGNKMMKHVGVHQQ